MNREQKIRLVADKIAAGQWSRHIIEEAMISRRTFFYWKQVIEEQGIDALLCRAKPGTKPSYSMDRSTEAIILKLRKKYGWGSMRIEGHLEVHKGLHVPHNRIEQLFKAQGLDQPIGYERRSWGKKRWERPYSMYLWQADWKDVNTEPGPMLTYLDDHARYIVVSERCNSADTETSIRLFEKAIRRYGKPEQILTDNGVQFCNNVSDEPSSFDDFCTTNGIEHIRTSKKRPTTTGKIEAFHGNYEREAWRFASHAAYIHHWNHSRPHSALGYLYPAQVFYRDRRGSATN